MISMLFPSRENNVIAQSPRPTIKASRGITPISILVRRVVIIASFPIARAVPRPVWFLQMYPGKEIVARGLTPEGDRAAVQDARPGGRSLRNARRPRRGPPSLSSDRGPPGDGS